MGLKNIFQSFAFVFILMTVLTINAEKISEPVKENVVTEEQQKEKGGTSVHQMEAEKTFPYEWSNGTEEEMTWDDAKSYCENLDEKGHGDWRLPTITELRTLIKNCPSTEPDGECKVSENCLSGRCWSDACKGCLSEKSIIENCGNPSWIFCLKDNPDVHGKHSILGNIGWFWSSSQHVGGYNIVWYISFNEGFIAYCGKEYVLKTLCVRKKE
jgi:hypothetical protein